MKLWQKIILSFLGLIIVSCILGLLIIYVTPRLYNIHPLVSNTPSTVKTQAPEVIVDSLIISGDSLIYCQRTINKPTETIDAESPTMGDLGTFGDSAGFWNAIFSALAMIFVAITLFYQFNKDSKEDERARIAQFQEQCLTMLSMLSEIVSQLRIAQRTSASFGISSEVTFPNAWNPSSNQGIPTEPQVNNNSVSTNDITGRACFKYIYDERGEGRNIRDYLGKIIADPAFVISEDVYRSLKIITETHFDHYFRTVYRIFKFIKESDLGDIDKKKQDDIRDLCADLIRAQLSTYELAILYYNGLYPKYRNTSKPIYEHFCLFDNLDPQYLILQSEKEYYKQVQIHNKNLDNYDNKIHYNCTAFTKVRPSSNKTARLKRLKIRWPFKRNSRNIVNASADIELTDEERAVYNALKSRSGQVSTIKELVYLSRVNKTALKKALDKFDGKLIQMESATNGNRYTVIKDLDEVVTSS